MRQKDVAKRVRALGLTVRYTPDFMEWRVDYRRDDPRWTAESAYFTTCADDAIGTAKAMAIWQHAGVSRGLDMGGD